MLIKEKLFRLRNQRVESQKSYFSRIAALKQTSLPQHLVFLSLLSTLG